MITYIELWKAKQAWINLSKEERGAYMTALGPAIQQLTEAGVQIISWGVNDASTFSKAGYDYFAVWSFPTEEGAKGFEKIVILILTSKDKLKSIILLNFKAR